MKKNPLLLSILLLMSVLSNISAQKLTSTKGEIHFRLDVAQWEVVEATSQQMESQVNLSTGQIRAQVAMKALQFNKELIAKHFHENVMESGKYPMARFDGYIINLHDIEAKKSGTYPIQIEGRLQLHGKSQPIVANGSITNDYGIISLECQFGVRPKDFDLQLPDKAMELIDEKEVKVQASANLGRL